MAEIIQPQKGGRRKALSTRVDLTPMVDLGFLLITFFIFTTTMARPNTMEINMPHKTDDSPTAYIEESTITVIPTEGHAYKYYHGRFDSNTTPVATNNIRQVLLSKQKAVAALPATFSAEAHKVHVVIKPAPGCVYGDVVDLLDEMNILDIRYYAVDDISQGEMDWLDK